jgi:23S rRNA (pseudouridine1915-N3)-methyltransferase
MKFIMLCAAHRMPAWIDAGYDEYARRLPAESRLELRCVKPADRHVRKPVAQWLDEEASRIRAALPPRCYVVVLDERGKSCTTADLARRIGRWRQDGLDVAFVIGGADGTAQALRDEADLLISVSGMTLPHGLVRVLLAEQLYRAVSLLAGHPYHRA